ncbi:hypothetical protein IWX49DRAFT_290061 [Phyllosticta citricarpa]|uniref:Uncharacterized protein n=1 Tax=Phyllosticta paracitricarpa TaxID=2016321 RepID=A0ABR1NHG3_9PEZI
MMYLARPLLPYQTRSPPEQASAAHRPPRHSKQVRIAVRRTRASASQYSGVGDQSTTKGDSVITTTSAANRRPCRIRTALRQGHEHPPPSFAAPFPDHHFPRLLAWPGLADKQAGRQCWTDTRSRSRWQRPSRVFRLDKRRVGCTGRHCCGMRSSQAHAWEACIAYPCRPTAIASDRAIPAAASRCVCRGAIFGRLGCPDCSTRALCLVCCCSPSFHVLLFHHSFSASCRSKPGRRPEESSSFASALSRSM